MAEAVGKLHGAGVDIAFLEGTPPLRNEPAMARLARQAAAQVVDAEHIRELPTANMGGEDFSYYLEKTAGCYVRFGAQVAGRESYPAHSSKFDFDERALAIGAAYFHAVARIAGARLRAEPKV
jgi:metal-dependent amidase/aminoacylase/carboxypeptidase family protein